MDHFTLSLCVGAAAGALDVLPKVFQGASARSCFSAFFIFLFSAVIVFHADLPYLPWWADGMGTTLMLSIPVFSPSRARNGRRSPSSCSTLCSSACSSVSRNATCRKDVTTGGFEDTTDRTMRRTFLPKVRFFGPTSVQYRRPAPYSRETACQAEPRPPMTSTAAAWRTTECAR